MSYALRNTLALGIVLLLMVFGGGYWTHVRMGGQLEELRQTETQRSQELEELNRQYRKFEVAWETLEDLQTKWADIPKVVPKQSSSASLFGYLNELLALDRSSSVEFNYSFQREIKQAGYGYGAYAVVGTGSFRDVYDLIWRIENERLLVKIASLKLQEETIEGRDKKKRSRVKFEMVLHAYYTQREMLEPPGPMGYSPRDPYVGHNPFYPLIQREIPPNTEGLVEVEGGVLEAMTDSWVMVRGGKGKRATLRVGDRVYLGRLQTILPDVEQAVFVLDKGGIVERVVLEMEEAAVSEEETAPLSGLTEEEVVVEGGTVRFLGIEVGRSSGALRLTIRNTGAVPYRHFELDEPPRIVLDMEPAVHAWDRTGLRVEGSVIREVRTGQFKQYPPVVRVVIELEDQVRYVITQQEGRILVDIRPQ